MKFYKRIDKDGKTKTVESYSHNEKPKDAIEIEKAEFDIYIANLPLPVKLPDKVDLLRQELVSKGILGFN